MKKYSKKINNFLYLMEQAEENEEELDTEETSDEETSDEEGGDEGENTGGFSDSGGFGDSGEENDSETLGRVYELKKIYNKLLIISDFLSDETDEFLIKLKQYTNRALDLFNIVISNINQFKDKLDDIIVQYYVFIKKVFYIIKKVYELRNRNKEE
ncbi:MAG: hypothetical protein KatS3mg002_0339 [Candidatus Woesearchaeota archaeon]|nr:MAG: hypothetical protein KatS3mg002_0339 [Candidatus Woesearchaeota archaeon]